MGSRLKIGIVMFPGSNCDHDAGYAFRDILQQDVRFLWHKDESLGDTDVVVLPGGFSYGDYLRCGAIARFSPIMKEVVAFGRDGGTIVGICNGFQILCEAGLLPGVLLRNAQLSFACRYVHLRVERNDTPFTSRCEEGEVLHVPIAHGEGNYFIDATGLDQLERERRILFRYCDHDGRLTESSNPNGSIANIAGLMNEHGNILGLMPHPERACDPLLHHTDGEKILRSVIDSVVFHERS